LKDGNWIPLDKRLASFLPRERPYTILEAAFSFAKDLDEEAEKSISDYSRIWTWSRDKVRRFTSELKTDGKHLPDRKETGSRQEIRLIFNNLERQENSSKTGSRQVGDREKTPTINPNPNPLEIPSSSADEADTIITKKKRKLTGKRLETFLKFWEAFSYKSGRAEAADAWLDIEKLTMAEVEKIVTAAKSEALRRPTLISDGKTPKMAQGWLTARRWEDESALCLIKSDPPVFQASDALKRKLAQYE
jgi:arsenate reductase-like glutaredoxin family protein